MRPISKKGFIFGLALAAVFSVFTSFQPVYAAKETRVQVVSDEKNKAMWLPLDNYPKDYSNWAKGGNYGSCKEHKTLPWTMTLRGGQQYPRGMSPRVGKVFDYQGDCKNPMTDGGNGSDSPYDSLTEPGAWLYPRSYGEWARKYSAVAGWSNAVAPTPCIADACGNRNYSYVLDRKTDQEYFGNAKIIVGRGNEMQDNRNKSFMFTRNNMDKPGYCMFSNGSMIVGQKFTIPEDDYEAAMKGDSTIRLNFGADDYVIAYLNGQKVAATQNTAALQFSPINKSLLRKAPQENYIAFQVNDHITGDNSGYCNSSDLKMGLIYSLSITADFSGWKVTGTSSVSKKTVKRSDLPTNVTFSHKLSNVSKEPALGVNWYTEMRISTTSKARSGTSNINASQTITPTNSSYVYTIPKSTPSGTQICQRIVFDSNPSKKKDYSSWACVVVTDNGEAGDVEYWTKYDGNNPVPPGEEITKYEHFLTDLTYKTYDGDPDDGGRWYSAGGYKQGDFFDHVDQHFKQDENEGEMIVSGSLNNREKRYDAPPNNSSVNGSYWPKEDDIGKTICQNFIYDMWVKKYIINTELRVHHYETWYDSDGNPHSYPVYASWFWLEIQPARKVYTNTTTKDCVEVGKKPKIQIWGSDADIGGSAQTSLMQPYYRELPERKYGKKFGSWAEYGILLRSGNMNSGEKTGTATASQLTGSDTGVNNRWWRLLFANDSVHGNFLSGKKSDEESSLIKSGDAFMEQFMKFPNSPSGFSGLGSSDGAFDVGNISIGGSVGAGKSIILRGDTVNITSDIIYPQNYASVSDIPQVVILANNINISGNVGRVDAWLLARNSINTCSDVAPKGSMNLDVCVNKLIVNGPVVTDKLYLNRNFGSQAGSTDQPAEIFNYRADAALWARKFATGTGKINTVHISEAAPRF